MPEYRQIPLALIDRPALQFGFDDRYDLDAEFIADIKKNGILVPLIVEAVGDRYRLSDGLRRWTAAQQLNLQHVPCGVLGKDDPPAQQVQLITTLQRVNQNHAEIAVLLGQLAEQHNMEIAPLIEATGQSAGWINDHLDLLGGDTQVLQALGENKINYTHARVLNRCKNDALRAEGLKFAIFDQIPARKLEEWIKRNDGVETGSAGVPQGASPAPAPVSNGEGGVKCAWCGGDRDPQNMVMIWLHRWEWDVVQSILKQAGQQSE